MVKYYELLDLTNDDGPRAMINACEDGSWVKREDCAAALKLIAEMKDVVFAAAGQYPHDSRKEFANCMELVARAEELLRD